ncbi:hypothetical protein Tco_1405749 [Tanacetum coccineum]
MADLKFAETHNLVAFLEKPDESDGFEQIVDFLNAHTIKYALTVNPTIYTSCIEQFWATAKVKTVNEEKQLQALVDKKKVIITESTIRRDLHLEDAEGTECLPTATIFEELTRMGYEKLTQKLTFYKAFFSPQWKFLIHTILQCLSAKTTAWNEFSSTMASAIICLATNQNFNFSKYIFDNMVKNLEGGVKFLMYPRFREGKGFSRRVTLLFQTMMVQAHEDIGEGSKIPTDPHHTPTITQPSTSQSQKKQPRRKQRKDTEVPQPSGPTEPIVDEATNVESVPTHSNNPLLSGEDRLKLNELMELYTTLQSRVLDLETTKTAQAKEIASLKKRVKKLERKRKSKTPGMKRLFKVGRSAQVISSDDEEVTLIDETQGRNDDNLMFDTGGLDEQEVEVEKIDKGKEKMIESKKPLKKKNQIMYDQERRTRIILWKLVKAKHGNTRPEEGYERVLWGDLKTMFEHHVEDLIWRNLQGKKINIKFREGLLGLKAPATVSEITTAKWKLRQLSTASNVSTARCCWYKSYNCSVRVNAADRVTTAKGLQLLMDKDCSKKDKD